MTLSNNLFVSKILYKDIHNRDNSIIGNLNDEKAEIFIEKKEGRMHGPLAAPFKGKIRQLPRRFLGFINPFGKSTYGRLPPDMKPVSPRAWSTVVGWTPGQSAFADDTHHEAKLGLLSIDLGK